MRVTNFYEIYLFMASYIVSWNLNAFSHWPIGVIVVFIIQLHKVEYNNARLEYSHPLILHGYLESWLFGQLAILYCKKNPVWPVGWAHYVSLFALLFSPYEKWAQKLGRKKSLSLFKHSRRRSIHAQTLHCDSYLRTK